jgi:siderophore synthetase component
MTSWLERLLGRSKNLHLNVDVKRRESLSLTVPAEKADAVRTAVERFLAEHGITTTLTTEDAANGKTRIKAALGEEDARKLDLTSDTVQSQLQDLLTNAVSSESSSS